jgi:hypothetical protein
MRVWDGRLEQQGPIWMDLEDISRQIGMEEGISDGYQVVDSIVNGRQEL